VSHRTDSRHRAVRARFSALDRRSRVLRRAGRDAVPGRGDRRDRALPARGQREHRRAVRDEHPNGRARRARHEKAGAFLGCSPERRRSAEHDRAQLPPHRALRDARSARATRSSSRARPRRERRAVARARARPRHRRRRSRLTTTSRSTTTTSSAALGRTRVVGFPVAANSVGTRPTSRDRRARARGGRARVGRRLPLRTTGPTRPPGTSSPRLLSSTKYFGPLLGVAFGKREAARVVEVRYKVRPCRE
jgi:hypothetical protein